MTTVATCIQLRMGFRFAVIVMAFVVLGWSHFCWGQVPQSTSESGGQSSSVSTSGSVSRSASETGAQPEFDEDDVFVAAPVVDVGPQAWKAGEEPVELRLRSLDPDRASCERLHKSHIGVQELRQSLWRRVVPEVGEFRDELFWARGCSHTAHSAVDGLLPQRSTLPTAARVAFSGVVPGQIDVPPLQQAGALLCVSGLERRDSRHALRRLSRCQGACSRQLSPPRRKRAAPLPGPPGRRQAVAHRQGQRPAGDGPDDRES